MLCGHDECSRNFRVEYPCLKGEGMAERTDTERIDWMDGQYYIFMQLTPQFGAKVSVAVGSKYIAKGVHNARISPYRVSARHAIDAAMEAEENTERG